MDYKTSTSPVAYNVMTGFHGITTTLDGKHVLMYHHDGNYNSKIIQLRLRGSSIE
jgi:hypothetical protein